MTDHPKPTIVPLGDRALLIRFGQSLDEAANHRAIAAAERLDATALDGVEEIAPGLVSVLVRYRPGTDPWHLAGELALIVEAPAADAPAGRSHLVAMTFDGEDLPEVSARLGLSREAFIVQHNAAPLRVLATGFAPGFVYCGFHPDGMVVPRRETVRASIPAGSVLFAAGQTAIAATPIRTGWHVIGTTAFRNFDPAMEPPTVLRAGDTVRFGAV